MRSPSLEHLTALISLALGVAGCIAEPSNEAPSDDAGKETGACIDGQCLGGLACLSDVCVDAAGATDDGGAPVGETMTAGEGSGDGDPGPSTDTTSTTSDADSTTTVGVDETSGDGSFIVPPDAGIVEMCSTYAQDCPAGQKCNAWASDVPDVWNATGCFDVVEDPDAVGEPCTVQFGPASGYDSCEVGATCWIGAGEGGEGICIEYCTGEPEMPTCPADHSCSKSNEGVVAVCLPGCDPIVQSCPEGQGCYLGTENFTCVPDGSGGAAYGSSCDFINGCTPGYVCLAHAAVGGCPVGSAGCCTPYCDIGEPDTCPGETQECTSAYGSSEPIVGLEHVGLCLLPD